MAQISVIVPTHNPDGRRLRRTVDALAAQSLSSSAWELLLVDNASHPPLDLPLPECGRIIREPNLGLSAARRAGFVAAAGAIAVLVDDDNELAPDYLEQTLAAFQRLPRVGVIGGRSLPEFEEPPPPWTQEFHALLALRDLGPLPQVSQGLRSPDTRWNNYPLYAPIGAGMALRRAAFETWVNRGATGVSDRRGDALTSGGDNDIVLCAMKAGWEVAYVPELTLTHLIPSSRLAPEYLARLNRGIQKSWMQVLRLHDANPWAPLTPAGARLRKAKAWWTHGAAWSQPGYIRWQGACGHFDGRVPTRSSEPKTPVQ